MSFKWDMDTCPGFQEQGVGGWDLLRQRADALLKGPRDTGGGHGEHVG